MTWRRVTDDGVRERTEVRREAGLVHFTEVHPADHRARPRRHVLPALSFDRWTRSAIPLPSPTAGADAG